MLIIVLASCASQDPPINQDHGYPVDVSEDQTEISFSIDLGYPIDNKTISQNGEYFVSEVIVPTPLEGFAVVHGKLLTVSDDIPYLAPSLYLGQILRPDNDPESSVILSSLSVEMNPLATQATNGDFVFIDVPLGEYGLFIWTPMSAFLIEDVITNKPIIIDVKEGSVLDLGTIYVP